MIVGAIYCKNPANDSGKCKTALPNNINGTAVATPDKMSQILVLTVSPANPRSHPAIEIKKISAIGVMTIVSIAKLKIELILTTFFNRPYTAKVVASTIDTQGNTP